jgi:hypothetical protein
MAVLWDVAPCSLVEINRRFRGAYYLTCHCDVALIEAVSVSETSVSFFETTLRIIPEDSHCTL